MDLTYIQDKMFTRFMPESTAGEDAWCEMASKMNGVAAVFNFEATKVISQLRKAGYKVGKAKPEPIPSNEEIDELLTLLGE